MSSHLDDPLPPLNPRRTTVGFGSAACDGALDAADLGLRASLFRHEFRPTGER